MSDTDDYRAKADRLLNEAACAGDMRARGRLIDEALRWHNLAQDATDDADGGLDDEALFADLFAEDEPAVATNGGAPVGRRG